MNIDKWKKKPSKKELYDIIKLQEERISELNKEMMKLNVVIRNEKPIRIDTQGLDYMVDLEQKYFVLQDIIKEIREYINDNVMVYAFNDKKFPHWDFNDDNINDILEILDKVEE